MEKPKPKISRDDVLRLSQGLPTRSKRGSRNTGHRLTQKEQALFAAARRQGFLKLPASGLRDNVENVYRLWCEAAEVPCVIKRPLPG